MHVRYGNREANRTGRCRSAVTVLAVLVSACGSDGPTIVPVAEVRPQAVEACATADRTLGRLADGEPGREQGSEIASVLLDLNSDLPSAPTEIGSVGELIGTPLRALRSAMNDARSPYSDFKPLADPEAIEAEIRTAVDDLNAGAARFDVAGCLDETVVDDVLLPQIDAAQAYAAEVAPTGDFEADVAAACERFRVAETDVLAKNVTDPNAQFLIFSRLRGLVGTLAEDLERFEVPAARRQELDLLFENITEVRRSISSVEAARLTSQEALDDALAEYDDITGEFEQRLENFSPGC